MPFLSRSLRICWGFPTTEKTISDTEGKSCWTQTDKSKTTGGFCFSFSGSNPNEPDIVLTDRELWKILTELRNELR